MNKSPILFLLLLALIPLQGFSEPASDEKMAGEAISPALSRDPEKRDKVLRRHFDELVEAATQAPDEVRPATVFFSTGLSYRELHDLRNDFSIEVIDVHMKAPQGDNGTIMSIGGGMADLFAIRGSFEERLTFMITSEQKCFAKMAKYMPAKEAKGMADLATRPFRVYAARIFGPNRSLRELQLQPNVRSVMLILRTSIISDFEAAKSYSGPHRYFMPGFNC